MAGTSWISQPWCYWSFSYVTEIVSMKKGRPNFSLYLLSGRSTFFQGDRGTSPGCFPKWARWLPCRVPPSLPAISPPIFQLWVFHLVQEVSEIANPSKAHLSLLSTLYLSLSSLLLLYPDTGNIDPITEVRGIPVREVVLELWSCCLSVGP